MKYKLLMLKCELQMVQYTSRDIFKYQKSFVSTKPQSKLLSSTPSLSQKLEKFFISNVVCILNIKLCWEEFQGLIKTETPCWRIFTSLEIKIPCSASAVLKSPYLLIMCPYHHLNPELILYSINPWFPYAKIIWGYLEVLK